MSKASIKHKANNFKLRIKEAFTHDQGRGIIRIDPDVFTNFDLRMGDTLQIYHPVNKTISAGILYSSRTEDKGKNIIRLGTFLMRNLQAKLGDTVEIRKIKPILAKQVLFGTTEIKTVVNYAFILAKKFQGRVINFGDILSFYYYGRRIDLEVVDYVPQAKVVRIHENTKFFFQKENSI